jgi:predicted transposase YdaD
MVAKPFDPTVKTLVETSPADWPVLLGQPAAPTDVIDADIATVSGAADKVLHVRAAPPYLVHLEFQAGHDSADLPPLLHLRSTLLQHRHKLLVRSAAVLLRPEADSPDLTEELRLAFAGEAPYDVFRYQVVRVWQLLPEPLLRGGLGLLPLAPISAVTEAELPGIIERMEARLQARRLRPHAEEVWSATYILLGLRYSRELARHLLRGVRSMKESVTYQAILEEGEAKGEAKGKVEGALAEARKFVLRQGRVRFGPPDTRVMAAVEGIADVERLEELGERLLSAASWQELLGLPAPRRQQPRRRPKA